MARRGQARLGVLRCGDVPQLETIYLDEGPTGWRAGPSDLTRRDVGCVDPAKLISLPGAKKEELLFLKSPTGRLTREGWSAFVRSVRRSGVREAVQVHVEIDGRAVIFEGNHRVRAALKANFLVPVEVSYFGNSQRRTILQLL